MNVIRSIFLGLVSLFIDDGSFALAIVALIVAATVAVKAAGISPLWGGILLLFGCIILLLESVYRAARRKLANRH